jgi:hypothetical protein
MLGLRAAMVVGLFTLPACVGQGTPHLSPSGTDAAISDGFVGWEDASIGDGDTPHDADAPPLAVTVHALPQCANWPAGRPPGAAVESIAVDGQAHHIYYTSFGCDRIEDYETTTDQFLRPIQLRSGSQPFAFDFSPDGSQMYAADLNANEIAVVDLSTRTELSRIKIPGSPALAIAVARNNVALIGTWLTPWNRQVLEVDLSSGSIKNAYAFASTTIADQGTSADTWPVLMANEDRTVIGGIIGDFGDGCGSLYSIFRYDLASNSFLSRSTSKCISWLAIDPTGRTMIVDDEVFDGRLGAVGVLPRFAGLTMTVLGGPRTAFRVPSLGLKGVVEALDIASLTVSKTLSIPVQEGTYQIAAGADGRLLAVVTDSNLVIYANP